MQKKIVVGAFVTIFALAGVSYYLFSLHGSYIPSNSNDNGAHTEAESEGCLKKGETAQYRIEKLKDQVSWAVVSVLDKSNSSEKREFRIELPIPDHYHPLELQRCGVYATKSFNYDYVTRKAAPDYKIELWGYDYQGEGRQLVFLSGSISRNGFSADFRVDPTETYVVLERSYLGNPEYALVIKNLNTKEDEFILSLADLLKKDSNLEGNFQMREWTKDGKYFWASIFVGADVLGFLRIERDSWKIETFEVPQGTMGGAALHPERGYITYDDGPPWTGDDFYAEEWRREGKKISFYLYNLFTKQQVLLEKIDDPLWSFNARWISDTELEYSVPPGEKRIYTIR